MLQLLLLPIGIIIPNLGFEFYAKLAFMNRGYPRRYGHGKSWNRAHKHYKTNWTFWQRLFWIPVFKEHYEDKYRFMAYMSYAHSSFSVIMATTFLIDEFLLLNVDFSRYIYAGYVIFTFLRYIYDNSIMRGKI